MKWPVERGGKCFRCGDPNGKADFLRNPDKLLQEPKSPPPADAGAQ